MRNRVSPLGAVVACFLMLTGCARENTDDIARPSAIGPNVDGVASADATPSRGTIGVSLLTLQNPFFKVIGDNITATGKENGYETIVLSADSRMTSAMPAGSSLPTGWARSNRTSMCRPLCR